MMENVILFTKKLLKSKWFKGSCIAIAFFVIGCYVGGASYCESVMVPYGDGYITYSDVEVSDILYKNDDLTSENYDLKQDIKVYEQTIQLKEDKIQELQKELEERPTVEVIKEIKVPVEVMKEVEVEAENEKVNETNEDVVKTEQKAQNEKDNETTINSKKGIINDSLKGRGSSDSGRSEPNYVNVMGYVVTYGEYIFNESEEFKNTPWVVPTYEKDKQFYVENGAIEHKTEVIVKSQELEHTGYGNYSGYLLIERLDNNKQFYIDVNNFITKPYWTYDDLEEAASVGEYIAEFNQLSDYYPVDKSNDKVELDDGIKVLVVGKTGLYSKDGPDDETNSIDAIVFKQWKYGYGGVHVFFNSEDLSIVY